MATHARGKRPSGKAIMHSSRMAVSQRTSIMRPTMSGWRMSCDPPKFADHRLYSPSREDEGHQRKALYADEHSFLGKQ